MSGKGRRKGLSHEWQYGGGEGWKDGEEERKGVDAATYKQASCKEKGVVSPSPCAADDGDKEPVKSRALPRFG